MNRVDPVYTPFSRREVACLLDIKESEILNLEKSNFLTATIALGGRESDFPLFAHSYLDMLRYLCVGICSDTNSTPIPTLLLGAILDAICWLLEHEYMSFSTKAGEVNQEMLTIIAEQVSDDPGTAADMDYRRYYIYEIVRRWIELGRKMALLRKCCLGFTTGIQCDSRH